MQSMRADIANRLSGIAVAGFGLALWFVVIPAHTETVGYGWMRPQTLPGICAVLLIGLGFLHALRPAGAVAIDARQAGRVALVGLWSAGAAWAFARFGFAVTAPVFALGLIALIGERRPGWVLGAAAGVPVVIWLTVAVLLGRPLP